MQETKGEERGHQGLIKEEETFFEDQGKKKGSRRIGGWIRDSRWKDKDGRIVEGKKEGWRELGKEKGAEKHREWQKGRREGGSQRAKERRIGSGRKPDGERERDQIKVKGIKQVKDGKQEWSCEC